MHDFLDSNERIMGIVSRFFYIYPAGDSREANPTSDKKLNRNPDAYRFCIYGKVAVAFRINGDDTADVPGGVKKLLSCVFDTDIHPFVGVIFRRNQTRESAFR